MAFFFETYPRSRRPRYPRFRGDVAADVVVVGGGLTGCACAAVFAGAGVDVLLLESARLGAGATAGTPGLLRHGFDAPFDRAVRLHGLRAARHLWQSARRAALDFAAALRRYGIRCDLGSQDLLHFTRDGGEAVRRLRRDFQMRRDAGLDVSWLTAAALAREAGVHGDGAIRTRGDAVDPYRACLGLAARAAGAGARLHEGSEVRRLRAGRKGVEVRTAGGRATAQAVIVATGGVIGDLKALKRHLTPRQVYGVATQPLPAAVRRAVGTRAAALRDTASPPHVLRWLGKDRVLFSGAEQAPVAPRALDATLVQRSGQLMYELSTLYPAISGLRAEAAWPVMRYDTPDDLPLVGLHRNFPHHLFALGLGRHGVAASWLAARLLLRLFRGEPARGDDAFGFARIL